MGALRDAPLAVDDRALPRGSRLGDTGYRGPACDYAESGTCPESPAEHGATRLWGGKGCRGPQCLAVLPEVLRDVLQLPALAPQQVRVPRIPRRDVLYLTKEEIDQFLNAIMGSGERWETVPLARLRFRALVEVLLGTGARISEVLSLDGRDIDFQRREAKIVGKGNKQRILFFTDRALEWLGATSPAVGTMRRHCSSVEATGPDVLPTTRLRTCLKVLAKELASGSR